MFANVVLFFRGGGVAEVILVFQQFSGIDLVDDTDIFGVDPDAGLNV